jgi:hypothetical protein
MNQARNPIRITATAADSVVLAEEGSRLESVLIVNRGPATAYLDFGQAAEVALSIPLPPGSEHDFVQPLAWHCITDGGNAVLSIVVGGHVGFDGQGSGEPLGTAADPLSVETQQPHGNLADPIVTIGGRNSLGPKAPEKLAALTGNAASQLVFPANANRTHATILNRPTSTTSVWLGFGVAAENGLGQEIPPGYVFEIDDSWWFGGEVYFYGAATAIIARWES